MLEFRTSYDRLGILLKIFPEGIRIMQLPPAKRGLPGMCIIFDVFDKEIDRIHYVFDENVQITMPDLADGTYSIDFYIGSNKDAGKESRTLWSLFKSKSIRVVSRSRRIHFIVSDISTVNSQVMSVLPTPIPASRHFTLKRFTSPGYNIQSDRPEIVELARKLTSFSVTPLQKIRKIHDWVAENIYYDYDSLAGDRFVHIDQSAAAVLKRRRGVCSGYTYLTIALLRAVGVPAAPQLCHSLDISNKPIAGLDISELEPNHILCLAHDNYRWTINDVTWDSDNSFINEKYVKKTHSGISHNYFNATLEFISNTHIFFENY